jgi:hypothetical protein
MNKALLVAFCFLIIFLLTSCGVTSNTSGNSSKFQISCPYVGVTSIDIQSLSITQDLGITRNSSSSDIEIADAILSWQNINMSLKSPSANPDVSYPMRWNYILPGIYPVVEMVVERVSSSDGKIYGVCWDYAAIFNAIAIYYGLTPDESVRITAWKKYMNFNDSNNPLSEPANPPGMDGDEYNALKVKLLKNNLNFSQSQMNNSIKETYVHYRAEVKNSSGNWISYDGTGPSGAYLVTSNYSLVNWNDYYSSDLAYP